MTSGTYPAMGASYVPPALGAYGGPMINAEMVTEQVGAVRNQMQERTGYLTNAMKERAAMMSQMIDAQAEQQLRIAEARIEAERVQKRTAVDQSVHVQSMTLEQQ